MKLIKITHENIASEHICCAISNRDDVQVNSKKAWIKDQLDEGLVFLKGDVRGKCFIEYIPAENAWVPIDALDYMFINCLWVSGQFKGQGYSNLLLEECIQDSKQKGKQGLVILSSKKKLGFLSDPKYMAYKGFVKIDHVEPYFDLMYLPFYEDSGKPQFKQHLKQPQGNTPQAGFVLYYTHQCPFTAKYVPLLEAIAKQKNILFQSKQFLSKEQAQKALTPFTTYALFYNGEFITHEILSEKKFEKILVDRGL